MTRRQENEFLKRMEAAKSNNIIVPEKMTLSSEIRGVYGFFAIKGDEEVLFYIGKSNIIIFKIKKKAQYGFLIRKKYQIKEIVL